MRTRPFSARLRQLFRLTAVAGLVLSGAAGCGSSRPAYQFRAAAALKPEAIQPTAAASVSVPPPAVSAATARLQAPARPAQRPPAASRRLLSAVRRPAAPSAAMRYAAARPLHLSRSGARRVAFAPQRPTEVGLGTTVLGVLGLVVLPLSLLGLLIWGGPVWAVLAGLAALAVLVAYIDPFR